MRAAYRAGLPSQTETTAPCRRSSPHGTPWPAAPCCWLAPPWPATPVNPRTGTLLVSDEYGPSVRAFSRSGELLRTDITPANLLPRNTSSGPYFGNDDGSNNAGKRTNRGFEGLAISPDGQFAYARLQSATLDEGGGNGSVNRSVKFDTNTRNAVAQYAYAMQRSGQGQRGVRTGGHQ